MSQHTPGPWSITNDGAWFLVMAGGVAGQIVANVNPESCPDSRSAPAFRQMPGQANAHLIAAAPELLEASKVARHALSELIATGDRRVFEAALSALDAVIARAEGRS